MCIQEFPLWIRIWKRRMGVWWGGGADTWAQCQPCRATSNRRLFPLSFPGPEYSADEAKKHPTMLLFSTLFHCSATDAARREDIWKIGQIESSPRFVLIPWLLMERIFLIRASCRDSECLCMRRKWGSPSSGSRGQTEQHWGLSQREGEWRCWTGWKTHQETGMVAFPLVTTQFFSSGLIMVGETVRWPLALTIGRDLLVTNEI